MLTFWPETELKEFKVLMMDSQFFLLALANRVGHQQRRGGSSREECVCHVSIQEDGD